MRSESSERATLRRRMLATDRGIGFKFGRIVLGGFCVNPPTVTKPPRFALTASRGCIGNILFSTTYLWFVLCILCSFILILWKNVFDLRVIADVLGFQNRYLFAVWLHSAWTLYKLIDDAYSLKLNKMRAYIDAFSEVALRLCTYCFC